MTYLKKTNYLMSDLVTSATIVDPEHVFQKIICHVTNPSNVQFNHFRVIYSRGRVQILCYNAFLLRITIESLQLRFIPASLHDSHICLHPPYFRTYWKPYEIWDKAKWTNNSQNLHQIEDLRSSSEVTWSGIVHWLTPFYWPFVLVMDCVCIS